MNILIVYSDLRCSCTRKGTFELSRGLKLYTQTDVLHHLDLKESHFKKYDIIIFQRLGGNGVSLSDSYFIFLENLIKKYKNKVYTAYILDDLIIQDGTQRMMSLVDTLLIPNQGYDSYVSSYNKNIFYTRTFIDLDEIESIPSNTLTKDKINLLWASTGGVGTSFMQNLIPIIQEKIPNAIVHILGGSSSMFKKFKNAKVYPIVPYEEFIQYFKSCDIYLNPITIAADYFRNVKTIDFLNCKSELKYITAGAVKKPIISSKSHPYEYAIKNGINGMLLDNDVNSWIDSILLITNNTQFKNKLIYNAYEDVSNNYTLKSIGEKLYKFFNSCYSKNNLNITSIQSYRSPSYIFDKDQSDSNTTVGEIFGNKKVFQSFSCTNNNLFKIDIKFGTYMRENKGVIRISLSHSIDGVSLISKDIPCETILDNQWLNITFEPILDSKDRIFFIRIEGINCRIGSSVTAYYMSNKNYSGNFYINKTKFNGCLTFRACTVGS